VRQFTIAITADLHWGVRPDGDAATRQLVAELVAKPPDLLILAGDIGAGADFERCLELFSLLPGRKALVPGNHDIWVNEGDARGNSWDVYSVHLPKISTKHGFHYLDHSPLLLPELNLAVVGSINWYDYSWAIEDLPKYADEWAERLENKRFTRGRHNDGRFVRWHFTDVTFTQHAVGILQRHLADELSAASRAIVVTHHPAFFGLNYPSVMPPHLDQLLWRAFSGNRSLENLLERHADRIAFAFSGHTHKERENNLGTIRGYNIGGDYDWKRLLKLSWPEGRVTALQFRRS
jgi:3',5'-cyclic AMP phosphodiesterase CpdA